MKIVVLDAYGVGMEDWKWEKLRAMGECDIYERTPEELVVPRLLGADIAVTNKAALSREVMGKLPTIKYISILATGYDNVDVEGLSALHIPVSNIPAYSTYSVAQQTFALLLEIVSRTGRYADQVREGAWAKAPDYTYRINKLTELYGLTMGIIGTGEIGSRVARIADAFGMKVICWSRRVKPEIAAFAEYVSKEELFGRSDVISLHVPATEETVSMINEGSIAKMKDGVIILNTARGKLIDPQALADALASGKVAAAGLDVLYTEPPAVDDVLTAAPNTVITPHIAWATEAALRRVSEITAANVRSFIDGHPQNLINRP